MAKKYTCPYCFQEHGFSDVEFRCVNGFCSEKVQDEQYANFLGLTKEAMKLTNATFRSSANLPKLFRGSYMPMWEICPHCQTKSSVRVCPSCHNVLPEGIQDNEDEIIAIVGSRDTGKTHFISVLINELQQRICPGVLGGMFNPMNDDVYKHYRDNFYNKVYIQKQLQNLTASGNVRGESVVRKPLIYEMIIPLDEKGKRKKKYTFVFYDTAGENLNHEEVMKTVNRYICKASGLIFLLDPLQIMQLRINMEEEEVKSSSSILEHEIEPQEMVLQRIANVIREERGWKKTREIDVPTAIAFSKFDVLKRFFPKGSIVLEPSSYLREGHLDKNEWFTVNSEIRAMLQEWGAGGFLKNVEMTFKNYTYCTVSALGQQPVISQTGGAKELRTIPRPHRVEDPFLWILKENNIIKER
ncbi:MAG: hypothetical protein HFH38_07130 [Lachnospiraceae bacterium]|jgi:hypothetical protein|nr:hypothetical protein [Lachnospiraceae bacterium]